jgi:hypothetical protein
MRKSIQTAVAVGAVLIAGVACGDADTVGLRGPAQVTVLLTDAAVDYIDEAWVDIGAVELVPADDSGPIITLSEDGTDGPVNLLELQDAATEMLADAEIEAGSYSQLRLIVESASVKLADEWTFTDGSTEKDLKVPSGAQTGIKLVLTSGDDEEPLEIPPGELVLVVDFDVSQSFVIQGNPETPAGIHGMLFKPTLRVVVMDVAGSIAGTVTAANDSIRVDSLRVRAVPVDDGLLEEFQTETATTRTGDDGTYTLRFLVPGEYTVRVTPADTLELRAQPDSIRVVVDLAEDVDSVDFEIDSIP